MASRRARVAYLGPAGTFSEEALLASAAADAVEPVGLMSIPETIEALAAGEVRWAVVPIENSLEGSVSVTLDALARGQSHAEIVGEALLRVRHSLIGVADGALAEIETVLTHPQVPGQCARFLRAELPRARLVPASSTAEAVRVVIADARAAQAAIGTRLAAEIYGGVVLREGIEDRDDNETRFVWLARSGEREPPPLADDAQGEWKTSVVFWGPGAEHAGWLVRCLDEFSQRRINLTKIESRPRRRQLGSYMFFADLAGRAEDEPVADALAGLAKLCEQVRVLGSYRSASH